MTDIDSIVYSNTMCSKERVKALSESLQSVINTNVPGQLVECGTWRGGLAALMLHYVNLYKLDKSIYIYDTFEGMPEPGDNDCGTSKRMYEENKGDWCRAGVEVVRSVLQQVDPSFSDVCYLFKGKVEDTLDIVAPLTIALARLDTDWYDSTKKELEVLYPRVQPGGYVLIDDYTDWSGCRQAVDEYLANIDKATYNIKVVDGSLVIQKK